VTTEDRGARGVHHRLRAVDVGEALTEVDRPGPYGERRHLGEDRRAEAFQPGRHPVHP
jgi:hypothetical protein